MGVLDDAIREHLDLKRRRGADPADVERAEREALGPVRRVAEGHGDAEPGLEFAEPAGDGYEFASGSEFAPDLDFAAQPEFAGEAGDDSEWPEPYREHDEAQPPIAGQPVAPEPVHERPIEPVGDPAIEHSPAPSGPAEARTDHTTAPGDRLFFEPEPEPERQPLADAVYEDAGGETVEYDVEHSFESESEADSAGAAEHEDDVLEETPEFLQDTPDHDRLWFEQRPPRDFDFDG